MKHHVIYIPGIDDDIGRVQSRLIKLWRFQGVQPQTFVIPWAGDTNFDVRKRQLNDLIKTLGSNGEKISLVGSSAGGCAVLTALIEVSDRISCVAMICPKIINANNIGDAIVSRNPAFKQAMVQLQPKLNELNDSVKAKLINFISPSDGLVSYHDSSLAGVKEVKLPRLKHSLAILYALTFGSRRLIKELKRIADSA